MAKAEKITPETTRRDEAPYWGAVLILSLRAGNQARAAEAQRQLKRLGVRVDYKQPRKGVRP